MNTTNITTPAAQLAALTADHIANIEPKIADCDRMLAQLRDEHARLVKVLEVLGGIYTPTDVSRQMDNDRQPAVTKIAVKKAEKAGHPSTTVTCNICGKTMGRMGLFNHMASHQKAAGVDPLAPGPTPLAAPTPLVKKQQPVVDDRALLVRCEDCDVAYQPHMLRVLAEHVRNVHKRHLLKSERTPSVA